MFLNATMLAGVAGAMVPLVLHLLSRARYRNVDWGAMMFLGAGDVRQHRGSRLKELTLLLLRMAIIAVLAIALARPVVGPAAEMGQNPQKSMVIVLDRSSSMSVEENGPPRMESARRAALEAVTTLRPGDEAALVLLPDAPQATQLTTDVQLLAGRIADVRQGQGRADFAAGLTSAAKILQSSRAPVKQLVLVGDRQASGWKEVTDAFVASWRQSVVDSAGQMPRVHAITVGGNDAGNVAIESLQILNPPAIQNVMADVEVRVRNFDTIPSVGLPLTISIGNRELYRTLLNLPAGASTAVRCGVRFAASGSQVLTARIAPAGLSFDDVLEHAVEVSEPLNVLVISGEPRDESSSLLQTDADMIRLALTPFQSAGQSGPDPARVEVVSSEAWPELDRSRHRVAVLANVPRVSMRQARQLEQFVSGGGGLLVAPGSLTRIEDCNALLWRRGAGVLPAELAAPTPADGSQATSLLGLEMAHPIFRFLQDRQDPLPRLIIGRYFPVNTVGPRGTVLGRFASGKPFIVEGSTGRGRVLLFTTPLDADWNTLPLSSSFLPLVQSSIRYLAAGIAQDRNLSPGEPIVATFADMNDPSATIDGPVIPLTNLEPQQLSEGYEFRFTNTIRPGRYTLRVRDGSESRTILFVVRPVRDESDLSGLSEEQMQKLGRLVGLQWPENDPQTIASIIGETHRGELWAYLLAAVIGLALLEIALARFWTVEGGVA